MHENLRKSIYAGDHGIYAMVIRLRLPKNLTKNLFQRAFCGVDWVTQWVKRGGMPSPGSTLVLAEDLSEKRPSAKSDLITTESEL